MAGFLSNLSVLRAIFVKDFKQMLRYPAQILMMFVLPFFLAILVRAMGSYVGGVGSSAYFAQQTGTTNVFVYQVLGGLMWLQSWIIIDRIGSSLREERYEGTLEQVYLSPVNRFLLLVSKALVSFVTTGITFLGVVVLSVYAFDGGALGALPESFLLLSLGLIPLWGMSFLFAGVVMRFKEPYAFVTIINLIFSILIGTFYPITILPYWAQLASRALPQTYALDAMRQVLLGNNGLVGLTESYAILLGMALVYPVLGYLAFKFFLNKARVNGDLSRF